MKLHRLFPPPSHKTRSLILRFLAAFAFLSPLLESARAVAYTFTNIADSDGIFSKTSTSASGIGDEPLSINNAGTVAFSSRLDDGGIGVFSGSGGPITNIALSNGSVFSNAFGASINSAGTVAFYGSLDAGGNGIFTGNGGSVTTIAVSNNSTFSDFGNPVINDAGTVAFRASLDSGDAGIFAQNGGSTSTIALVSGPKFGGVGFNLSINSAGTVAFLAGLKSGQVGMFTGSGGPTTTIALGNFFPGIGGSINDAGTVAFTLGGVIYTGSGSNLTTVADISGAFSGFGFFPAINNGGNVAFFASLDNGFSGVFTGSDPVADKVIETGDMLFGTYVDRLSLVPPNENPGNVDINDLGQVAFHYELSNGVQGIAVATPVVPEPGIAFSVLIGAALFGGIRHRRIKGLAAQLSGSAPDSPGETKLWH